MRRPALHILAEMFDQWQVIQSRQLQVHTFIAEKYKQCHARSASLAVLVLRLINALLMLIHADQRLTP